MATPVIFDSLLELADAVTHTATTAVAGVEFPLTVFHEDNDEHDQTVDVVFDIVSSDEDGGAIDLLVEVDTALAFPSAVEVVRWVAVPDSTSPRRIKFPIDLATVKALEPGATHIRVQTVVTGGTTPTITYTAYLARPAGG